MRRSDLSVRDGSPPDGAAAPSLTVAICTYNPRPALFERVIRAVVSQFPSLPSEAELLIIDNNSDTPVAASPFLRDVTARVICEKRQGLTVSRETAIHEARGDIIVFVDDDNILSPGYLQAAVEQFGDARLGVLGGRVLPEYESPPPAWLRRFEPQLAIRRVDSHRTIETTGLPYSDHFPVGAGSAVRRTLALSYLDDVARTVRIEDRRGQELTAGGDLDLDFFALSVGHTLRVAGSLTVTHVIPAGRCTEGYVSRLVVTGLESSLALDRKWSARLGGAVFPYLHAGRTGARLRLLAFGILSPFSAYYRIKRRTWQAIVRLQDHLKNADEA